MNSDESDPQPVVLRSRRASVALQVRDGRVQKSRRWAGVVNLRTDD